MAGPLDGVRVIDVSQFQQGPYCSVILSDMGAEVIKVERPEGEVTRDWYVDPPRKISPYFLSYNRNKKSLTTNLKHPQGREIIYKLIGSADVFLQNFRPGVANKLGFSYEALSELKPRIIYASGSGYGPDGPYGHKPGFDGIGQAISGLMYSAGGADRPPGPVAAAVCDQVSAINLALGITLALFARERTGVGQQVDVCLLNTAIGLLSFKFVDYLNHGELPKRRDRFYEGGGPFWGNYKCKDDRWIHIGLVDDERWPKVCQILNKEDLRDDVRFNSKENRSENVDDLVRILDELFLAKPADEWLEILEALDIVCAPVNDYPEVANHLQVKHNQMIVKVKDPIAGELLVVANPVKLSKTSAAVRGSAPILGQHTEEILLNLGYTRNEIESFRQEKII